jgi:hypothetical protein
MRDGYILTVAAVVSGRLRADGEPREQRQPRDQRGEEEPARHGGLSIKNVVRGSAV